MREIWSEIEHWRSAQKPTALVTVIKVEGSSLRPLSSKMAITSTNDIAGSVSGGCVESAVVEEAIDVIHTGVPRQLNYGISDSLAQSVGLACGGSIKLYVESLQSENWQKVEPEIQHCLAAQKLAAVVTVVGGPGLGKKLVQFPDGSQIGDLGSKLLNKQVAFTIGNCWTTQSSGLFVINTDQGEVEVFADLITPNPRLVIIGAVHIAIPLVTVAKVMGFHTIVIDARSVFATRERFPNVDELIVDWPSDSLEKLRPDPATYIVCLSHDDKFDNPALQVALDSPARYVGVLGSQKTHAARLEALREMGVPEDNLARIHAPIGLDLGARLPEEIALSIMAEIIAEKHGISKNKGWVRSKPIRLSK